MNSAAILRDTIRTYGTDLCIFGGALMAIAVILVDVMAGMVVWIVAMFAMVAIASMRASPAYWELGVPKWRVLTAYKGHPSRGGRRWLWRETNVNAVTWGLKSLAIRVTRHT